jgi:hypothetical protein
MIEVKGFENEAIQQEQRSVKGKQTMFVIGDKFENEII